MPGHQSCRDCKSPAPLLAVATNQQPPSAARTQGTPVSDSDDDDAKLLPALPPCTNTPLSNWSNATCQVAQRLMTQDWASPFSTPLAANAASHLPRHMHGGRRVMRAAAHETTSTCSPASQLQSEGHTTRSPLLTHPLWDSPNGALVHIMVLTSTPNKNRRPYTGTRVLQLGATSYTVGRVGAQEWAAATLCVLAHNRK